MFDKINTLIDEKQIKAGIDAGLKQVDETVELAQGNIDAVVEANAAVLKNTQVFAQQFVAFQKQAIDASVANIKALAGIKDMSEAVELQTKFARERFDASVEEANKLSEMTTKATDEAVKPLKARVEIAMQKGQALQQDLVKQAEQTAKAA